MPEAASRMHEHPGEMTAQMRAVRLTTNAPSSRRILRVAIVQQGQVLAEQCFERARQITIGPTQADSFVVLDPAITTSTRIFDALGKARRLHVPAGAHARVAGEGEQRFEAREATCVVLTESSRGRLTIGRTTILFSVEPEKDKPRPVPLPTSVKQGLQIDWTTTVIAAFSFLFHFGLLGAIYSEWQDPVVDDGLTIAKLVETLQDLPTPPPVEDVAEEAAAVDESAPKLDKEEKKHDDPKRAKVAPNARRSDTSAPKSRDNAQLRSQLAEMDILMHGALTSSGPAMDRVLDSSNVSLELLNAAAKRDAAVSRRPGDLAFSREDTSHIDRGGSLDRFGDRGDGDKQGDAGRAKETDGPKVKADRSGEDPTRQPVNAEIPDAQAVIGRLQGGFRRCYQNGLDRENSDMQGSVRLTIKVGPNGEVTSATASGVSGTLSGSVVSCMVSRASGALFKAPKGGVGAVLVVPVISKKQ